MQAFFAVFSAARLFLYQGSSARRLVSLSVPNVHAGFLAPAKEKMPLAFPGLGGWHSMRRRPSGLFTCSSGREARGWSDSGFTQHPIFVSRSAWRFGDWSNLVVWGLFP